MTPKQTPDTAPQETQDAGPDGAEPAAPQAEAGEPSAGATAESEANAAAETPEAEPSAPRGGNGETADAEGLRDRYLRLAAEFDNYRKRNERERAEAWNRAQGELAGRMLDALDDLERVSQHAATATVESLLEGVQMVERKLRNALSNAGLEEVDAEGAAFDPNAMEAVAMVGTDSRAEDDVVSDVFQRGYTFKGTLLRPARVRVKKHGA
jgi:molecular chaperone GrpE